MGSGIPGAALHGSLNFFSSFGLRSSSFGRLRGTADQLSPFWGDGMAASAAEIALDHRKEGNMHYLPTEHLVAAAQRGLRYCSAASGTAVTLTETTKLKSSQGVCLYGDLPRHSWPAELPRSHAT